MAYEPTDDEVDTFAGRLLFKGVPEGTDKENLRTIARNALKLTHAPTLGDVLQAFVEGLSA